MPTFLYASSTSWVTVEELEITKYGVFLIKTTGQEIDPPSCNTGTNPHYALQDIEGTKILRSMVLAAYMAGKELSISVHSTACEGGYPMINSIKSRA